MKWPGERFLPRIDDFMSIAYCSSVRLRRTNPNPRPRPVALSRITIVFSTLPKLVKNWASSPSVVWKARPPTNSLIWFFSAGWWNWACADITFGSIPPIIGFCIIIIYICICSAVIPVTPGIPKFCILRPCICCIYKTKGLDKS
jgi:hypothetical protein